MYCYFLCDTPCAVKADGVYLGIASKNLTFFESERSFLEFIPLNGAFCACNVFFDCKRPVSGKNAQIIDLYGGFLIIPQFLRKTDNDFKMVGRRSFPFSRAVTATCYNQGGIKLCISKENDFLIEPLPFIPRDVRFETCSFSGKEYLVAVCICDKTEILAFEVSEKITLAFKNLCDGYSFNKNSVTTLENKNDVLKHTLSSTWQFGERVTLKNYTITRKRQPFTLPSELIPIAFFEEIFIDGDVAEFLCPELKQRAEELKEFLGNFTRILPPPHFKNDSLVTLIYDNRAEYASVTLQNGLVANVTLDC